MGKVKTVPRGICSCNHKASLCAHACCRHGNRSLFLSQMWPRTWFMRRYPPPAPHTQALLNVHKCRGRHTKPSTTIPVVSLHLCVILKSLEFRLYTIQEMLQITRYIDVLFVFLCISCPSLVWKSHWWEMNSPHAMCVYVLCRCSALCESMRSTTPCVYCQWH